VECCPRTGVKEIQSYLNERAVRAFPIRTHVLSLIDAIVGLGSVRAASVVRGSSTGVAETRQSVEVRDAVGLGVQAVKACADPRQKLVNLKWRKIRRSEHVPACDWNRSDARRALLRECRGGQRKTRGECNGSGSGSTQQRPPV